MKHQILLTVALWGILELSVVHSLKLSTQDVLRSLKRIKAKAAAARYCAVRLDQNFS